MRNATGTARWYPTNISDSATHEAFRQAFDRLYATQDNVAKLQQGAGNGAPTAAATPAQSPAASLAVGAMVEAPKSSSSPGVLNQIYADGSYLYVYTVAGWRRVLLSSF